MIFFRSVGFGFAFALVGGIQVGRVRFEFGRAGIHPLVDRTDSRFVPPLHDLDATVTVSSRSRIRSSEIVWSENPDPLAFPQQFRQAGLSMRVLLQTCFSRSTISSSWFRNQGSILVSRWISSSDHAASKRIVDVGQPLRHRSPQVVHKIVRIDSFPTPGSCPVSSERTPFSSASLKVRPMAMTSPTDFIWVPSVGSASWNFSKFHFGIFTTT